MSTTSRNPTVNTNRNGQNFNNYRNQNFNNYQRPNFQNTNNRPIAQQYQRPNIQVEELFNNEYFDMNDDSFAETSYYDPNESY